MRTVISLMVVAAVMVCLAGCGEKKAPEKPAPPRPEPEAAKASPAKIDGVLDDAVWKTARELILSKLDFGEAAKGRTRVLVAHDGEKLYLAAECFDSPENLKKLVADATRHDQDGIWNDDCVEFFIDPPRSRTSYYQIIINSKGVTWDGYHASANDPDNSWEPKYDAATKVGAKSWTVELAIPLSAFDRTEKSSTQWGFNVSHARTAADEVCFHSAPMDTSSHQPEEFGTLSGMPER